MADIGYVRSLVAGLSNDADKKTFNTIFEHILGNLKFGEVEHQERATNFQTYFVTSTTAAVANTEFTIAHGLTTAPHLAIQVLDLSGTGAQMIPRVVSRAADSKRLYFKSSSTSAPFALLIE